MLPSLKCRGHLEEKREFRRHTYDILTGNRVVFACLVSWIGQRDPNSQGNDYQVPRKFLSEPSTIATVLPLLLAVTSCESLLLKINRHSQHATASSNSKKQEATARSETPAKLATATGEHAWHLLFISFIRLFI